MRKAPTPEQKAAAAMKRADLIARSKPLQAARKSGLLPWAMLPTVNACLELIYQAETGQREFHTFYGWKELGYFPEKGTKGLPIWGQPINAKRKADASAPEGQGDGDEFEFFPVSYLFSAAQVKDRDGNRPPSYIAPNPIAAAVAAMPLALPAPGDFQPIAA